MPLTITSPAFQHDEPIPDRYGCKRLGGLDRNPEIRIADIPSEAQALAVIYHDPDAPGGDWDHWVFWDLPATVDTIPEDTEARELGATVGTNSWGRNDHGGPCPPSGTHRYVWDVYALDGPLRLPAGASSSDLRKAMQGHALAKGRLTGTFSA